MDTAANFFDSVKGAFGSFLQVAIDYLPTIAGAILLLLFGWLVSKLISGLVRRALKAAKFDELTDKVGADKLLSKIKVESGASWFVSKLVYWLLILVFITATADVLGWDMVTAGIASFFAYLPTLLVALVILVVGLFIAEKIKGVTLATTESIGVSGAKAISNIVYYLLLVIVVISALNQAGVDTSLITSHLTILFGSLLLAFAISYGLASKDIVSNMLSSYYGKGKYKVGQVLKIGEIQGEVIQIDSLSITIKHESGKVVFPTSKLLTQEIVIVVDVENE